MLEFAANTTISIVVEHKYNNTDLTLTGMKYEVLDVNSNILLAKTDVPTFTTGTNSTTIDIDGDTNQIIGKRDARCLTVYLITAAGEYIEMIVYVLKGNMLELTVLQDSFMTFAESVLTRYTMAEEQEYFDMLNDEMKAIALEEGFNRIKRLKFKIGTAIYTDITSIPLQDFLALDANFLKAIKKAQIAEANSIVENSPIRDKIKAGIISETIGESSMFFSKSMPNNKYGGLSDDTYDYIKDYVYRDVSSAHIWKLGRA